MFFRVLYDQFLSQRLHKFSACSASVFYHLRSSACICDFKVIFTAGTIFVGKSVKEFFVSILLSTKLLTKVSKCNKNISKFLTNLKLPKLTWERIKQVKFRKL